MENVSCNNGYNAAIDKRCPVCGLRVIGRTDKIYCSNECRAQANNEKRKQLRNRACNGKIMEIETALLSFEDDGKGVYIKIIALVTRLCKILYKFGR